MELYSLFLTSQELQYYCNNVKISQQGSKRAAASEVRGRRCGHYLTVRHISSFITSTVNCATRSIQTEAETQSGFKTTRPTSGQLNHIRQNDATLTLAREKPHLNPPWTCRWWANILACKLFRCVQVHKCGCWTVCAKSTRGPSSFCCLASVFLLFLVSFMNWNKNTLR